MRDTAGGFFAAFAEALDEADRCAGEIEFSAKLIFEKALEAEMERLLLIGEKEENGRSDFGLRDVLDAIRARFG